MHRKLRSAWIVLAIQLLYCATLRADEPVTTAPKIKLGRDTTYLVEPLDKDGYVDYLAAINQRCRRDVTAENNAAAAFIQALWPKSLNMPAARRASVGRELGIPDSPANGDYCLMYWGWEIRLLLGRDLEKGEKLAQELIDQQSSIDEFFAVQEKPWKADEHPRFDGWLTAIDRALDRMVEATRRPRWYLPYSSEGDKPEGMSALIWWQAECRGVVWALQARAMRRIASGRLDDAWQDVLAIHRLARLFAQGHTMVEVKTGDEFDHFAIQCAARLVHYGRPTEVQLKRMQVDLAQLRPVPSLADKIDFGERCTLLDAIVHISRTGPRGFLQVMQLVYNVENKDGDTKPEEVGRNLASAWASDPPINWDLILNRANQWVDRYVLTARMPYGNDRTKALVDAKAEIRASQKRGSEHFNEQMVAFSLFGKSTSDDMLSAMLIGLLMPDVKSVVDRHQRALAERKLEECSLWLALYRAKQETYPAALADLVPRYCATIPIDPFSQQPLKYERTADGYVLSSVGPEPDKDEKETPEVIEIRVPSP